MTRWVVVSTILAVALVPFHLAVADSSQISAINSSPGTVATLNTLQSVDDAKSDDIEVEGWLLSRPTDGIGEWQVEREQGKIVRVIGDNATRFESGIPPVGSWIKAKGIENADKSIQASRIRIDDYESDEIVVRLADNGVLSSTVASRYGLVGAGTLLQSGRIFLFRAASSDSEVEHVLDTIQKANDNDIVWAEYNFVGSAPGGNPFKVWGWGGLDPDGYENQFAFEQIHLAPASQQYKGTGITIAVLDTGIANGHTEFTNRLIAGWDMVADDADPNDEGPGFGWGHGTHVSGIVTHIAPQAKIMPVRVLDANGRGNTFTLAFAIDWAVAHGADVINLSLGTPYYSKVLEDAVANAIANDVVLVAAAGNNNSSNIQYPAGFDGVISVGAVDSDNRKASFSNYGEWVDLAAPGLGITSTIVGSQGLGYASWSGTSMATGFVSGAAALIEQKSGNIHPSNVLQRLVSQGGDIDNINSQSVGRMLNVTAAIDAKGSVPTGTPTSTQTATPKPTQNPTPSPTSTPVPTNPDETGKEKIFLPVVTR